MNDYAPSPISRKFHSRNHYTQKHHLNLTLIVVLEKIWLLEALEHHLLCSIASDIAKQWIRLFLPETNCHTKPTVKPDVSPFSTFTIYASEYLRRMGDKYSVSNYLIISSTLACMQESTDPQP